MISSQYEISDDDESFNIIHEDEDSFILISSDEGSSDDKKVLSKTNRNDNGNNFVLETSDNSEKENKVIVPNNCDNYSKSSLQLNNKRSAIMKYLFPNSNMIKEEILCNPDSDGLQNVKVQGWDTMIGGVKVNMPFKPYPCQVALISKVITAIKTEENCLLESPTGTGKTLALLCGALAWQQSEQIRIAQIQAEQCMTNHPELKDVEGACKYIASPKKNDQTTTPEKLFSKTNFGEMNIYDKPAQDTTNTDISQGTKRYTPLEDSPEDNSSHNQVKIYKKRCFDSRETQSTVLDSPEKMSNVNEEIGTPSKQSVPRIYYGARTHKQIEQVIKELKSTAYCGNAATMSVLSSRDYSCIRDFDRKVWPSKNDMCRGCVKGYKVDNERSNCDYYDNRKALDHNSLPSAFDLEDLVAAGKELKACPYYAARAMAKNSQIIFCPYNYLIEPGIRSSMQIDLTNSIVIIDEAHNIEDICRGAANCTITDIQIKSALIELEKAAEFRFARSAQDVTNYIHILIKTLKNWNDWFINQLPLVKNQPVNNDEAVYTWKLMDYFLQTLDNHNIGLKHYSEFKLNAELFCRRWLEDPRTLYGITQTTVNVLESLKTVFGYIFREDKKYTGDFMPALVRTLTMGEGTTSPAIWRTSQFNKGIQQEYLSLRLICMNPAVLFEGLKPARCIILASGTLSPLISLHSELGTEFKLKVSPNHVIHKERVWIGTLTTQPDGKPLGCTSRDTNDISTQDALGQTVLWASRVTPNGVLCFLPSYSLIDKLVYRWRRTGVWGKLKELKHVFRENKNVRDHNDIMEDYYKYVSSDRGAILFAVYRGKVSEGMDFKDKQARLVITVGVPFPNLSDMAVKHKMHYNDKYKQEKNLLSGDEWLRVQAYRALNQAVGRCVRHANDWGAVLLVDERFKNPNNTKYLSNWVKSFLNDNHYTFQDLVNGTKGLEDFMQKMTLRDNEHI